jgi:hypothetical protein
MTLLVVCQLDYVHSVKLIMSQLLVGMPCDHGGFTRAHVNILTNTIDYHGTS